LADDKNQTRRKTGDASVSHKTSQNETTTPDSNTKVHFSEEHVPSYVSGVRKPISVRIDTGVYKKYKSIAKRLFGSVCKPVETNMIAQIELAEKGVHFSNTIKPITIEKQTLVIERNLSRERRNLRELKAASSEPSRVGKCAVCGKEAYAEAFSPSGSQFLCRQHFEKAKPRLSGWREVTNERRP